MSSVNGTPTEAIWPTRTLWKFGIGQSVRIAPLDGWPCRIIARADYGCHQKYLAIWWINSTRHEEWIHESELLEDLNERSINA